MNATYSPSSNSGRRLRARLTSLLAFAALTCGPLAYAPAQAAAPAVSGQVTDSLGTAIQGAEVAVFAWDDEDAAFYYEESLGTSTDSAGRYALDLEPGTYKLSFDDYRYEFEYYNNKTTLATATAIEVESSNVLLDDVALDLLPTIRGHVTSEDAAQLIGARVVAYADDDGDNEWEAEYETVTDASGNYVLPVLDGDYVVGFEDAKAEYVPEYWDDHVDFADADVITLNGWNAERIDAELKPTKPAPRPQLVTAKRPRLTGWAAVGQYLRAEDGRWDWPAETITRQWLRNGQPIPGATGSTYTLSAYDVGAKISVRMTAERSGWVAASAVSESSAVVKWPSDVSVTSKPGKKKATLTVRVYSSGGKANGTIRIKLRYKVVKTVRLKNGKATITLKKLKRKARYTIQYDGATTIHGSAKTLMVRPKK